MMRITNSQITSMMHNSMNVSSAELGKLMQQMATGKRILLPSDDPIASVRVLRVEREEASLEQFRKNIANVSGSLSTQEANLKSTSDAMLNVRDLLLWAANGSNTSEDLAAMAGELSIIEDTIVSFANVRDEEGRYLFSGTLSDTQALTFDAATQTYSLTGNDKHRQAAVANGVLVDENVTAASVYGTGVGMLNELRGLINTLQDPALDATDPAVRQQIVDTMAALDDAHGRVLGSITDLGGRQNALTLLTDSNEDVSLVNQKIEGELSQLDYAGATIDLNNYQLALGATQKTYLKINEMSLFSLL
ncbi:Flagellar hook-associated protein 3 [Pseudomonas sp. THAF187a]|uniref:Flagellar hook-associated protein 3 n=2 Tax=Ectopseudomonas TaxID=3236654 RepID=A0A653B4R8_ECTOL|nr:Flagellar hook-associated protein 3 [Pseudomonas sp. THAF187a]QFT40343.1 Flagellar hook-associated protein 3 [Pseudomonas sp. THAF42]TNF13740.1 MAG: flagellar hook-associated protein 3 [Pseudomonadales bacterium]CAE6883727.1 Flagellar hook-associated protein flgL [Pseudomonas oleovorans]HIQ43713.1 flagellar hook-associated protein 3 [Pseudomonas oleovorans]|tara:strand:+ start:8105 stop:9022 length:918 start_codon:yes stop_codon:yes gene_type:complete